MLLKRPPKARAKPLLFLVGIAATMACFAARAAVSSGFVPAGGDDSSNPYSVIVERNIFHLSPPPPPPEPDKPKIELPDVKITGFVSVANHEKVLFKATSKASKEPLYYSLAPGERSSDGKLELVKIQPDRESVDVLNDGTLVTLTMKDDANKASGPGPVAAAASGGPPLPGVPPGGPAGRPMFPGRQVPPGVPGFAYPMRPRRNQPGLP